LHLVKEELLSFGYNENDNYMFIRADVGNEKMLNETISDIPESVLGRIDTLINNAGILKRGELMDLTYSDWIDVFSVNVFGIVNVSKILVSKCSNLSNIVNIGSIRGEPAISRGNNIIYSISKSTIPTLTAVMAKNLGPKIRVNAILPGTINTPQRQGISQEETALYGESNSVIPRLGKPEEVAELCYFIASEKGSYITGSSIVIDGGYTINYIK
jgi:NAD(P)-dependent dehydrogenase (short-subunit alcohol dehydrogenase family)